ncbi:hypothetical protein TWF481_005083 [Arthrobotrys musiformis]|uniref:Uncharacterized protein n=1 Tax=Arthrobotrys musiformis TaxID=47236 RepID=A0AAV9WEK5_9PEZI
MGHTCGLRRRLRRFGLNFGGSNVANATGTNGASQSPPGTHYIHIYWSYDGLLHGLPPFPWIRFFNPIEEIAMTAPFTDGDVMEAINDRRLISPIKLEEGTYLKVYFFPGAPRTGLVDLSKFKQTELVDVYSDWSQVPKAYRENTNI